MKSILTSLILICLLGGSLQAQQNISAEPEGASPEAILLKQASSKQDPPSPAQMINKRIISAPQMTGTDQNYLLGPGDKIELTVVGIPGLDRKEFSLDAQGQIFIPYLGQVEINGLSVRDVESKLIRMFAVSLLEDPQVTVGIKEYKSQYFYVMGSVNKPGKFPLIQSTDILDALALAEGLTSKADPRIKIYRYSQEHPFPNLSDGQNSTKPDAQSSNPAAPVTPIEISLAELLEGEQSHYRLAIQSGDVITVQDRKDKTYYILGDIVKPGAYALPSDEGIGLSQALANAGGILKTAAGKKMIIVRRKENQELPEQIPVNAYDLLKGRIRDVVLLENDIVLVPGSASKTLGKNFLSGVSGVLTTLLLIGIP
ncbi:MAG: polysaccharide biosynthesis/export family protein [Acidobacteria bacterium]|nr:polysaccharide biosynthesis/export family protein [Acidobacteriota bacterium]